ncbi:hypothetical protein [Streptomyces sp. TRM75561]|uniref:hypothetical protein n=1 Tax=Streptomyces sp. TRM75561 TaxID=2975269 RepID=UPI0024484736|nr:hypothetical protein [Streptomyces sp. TRM75561]MDH3036009.1 hypothetical protein [Streptomyces sp. TRM75561]
MSSMSSTSMTSMTSAPSASSAYRRSPFPRPHGADVPPPCEVPHFDPVRVRGALPLAGLLGRYRRRAVAAGLAVTAAALVAAGPRDTDRSRGHPEPARAAAGTPVPSNDDARPVRQRRAGAKVSAPVRIADAATVRLLRPGDRVDVIAAEETVSGGDARVVARGARVTEVPEPPDGDGGALVVLSVPRDTAAELAGASTTARLAVTLW